MPRKQELPALADVLALFEHEDAYATTLEVAVYMRTTPGAIDHLAYTGRAPRSAKPGKQRLYRVGDVKAWLAGQASSGQEPAA